MKLKNILENIQSVRVRLGSTDDDQFLYRQILDWLNKYRSLFIRQDYEKGRTLSSFIIQELEVPLEKADKGLYTSTSQCILRSKFKIPKPIEGKMKDYITYVGRIDYEMRFTEISEQSISSFKFTKYGNKYPRYFFRDDYLFLAVSPTFNIDKLLIRMVGEEPQKIEQLKGNIDPFNPYDWEYPISNHILTAVETIIKEKEFGYINTIPKDNENNGVQQ